MTGRQQVLALYGGDYKIFMYARQEVECGQNVAYAAVVRVLSCPIRL